LLFFIFFILDVYLYCTFTGMKLLLLSALLMRVGSLRNGRFLSMDSTLTAAISANYKTVPMDELLLGVSNRAVTLFPPPMKNTYLGLRHGESTANLEGIISSDLKIGSSIHGLTPEGKAQARRSAVNLISMIGRENLLEPGKVVFITSPFTRARETALEAIRAMSRIISLENEVYSGDGATGGVSGVGKWMVQAPVDRCILLAECDVAEQSTVFPDIPLLIREPLRERFFGEFDQKELIFYNKVWPLDQLDALNSRHGVESVQDVCARCLSLVLSIESEFQNKIIVFSSHADTLQIFQLFMSAAVDPRRFAEYRFRNGELRLMTSLTAPRVPMVYR